MKSGAQSGFTLVEVMVALFALSILTVAGTAILTQALSAREQLSEHTGRLKEIELARAIIKSDIGQATTRPVRSTFGGASGLFFDGGVAPDGEGARLLSLVRRGWANPGAMERRSSLQSVSYRLEDGNLIRVAPLRPDPFQSAQMRERIVLSGVRDVRVEFGAAGQWSSVWRGSVDARGGINALPDVVRLTLDLEDTGLLDQLFLTGTGGS